MAAIIGRFEVSNEPALRYGEEFFMEEISDFAERLDRQWSDHDIFLIRNMVEIGLLRLEQISGQRWQSGGETQTWIHVTPEGYDFLSKCRDQVWWKTFFRALWGLIEGITKSVVTPVVVSALTVYVMNYLSVVDK